MNRGGLYKPSELMLKITIYIWTFYKEVVEKPDTKKILFSSLFPREVFIQALIEQIGTDEEAMTEFKVVCCKGHSLSDEMSYFARKMFNIFTKNLASSINDKHREDKAEKSKKRIKKLTNQQK